MPNPVVFFFFFFFLLLFFCVHEMPNLVFWENITNLSSAELAKRVIKVKKMQGL